MPKVFAKDLQALGEDKFNKILNLLMRGEPALRIAREIQAPPPKGWGDFQSTAEYTLAKQLIRLRKASEKGMFGKAVAKQIVEGKTPPQIAALEHITVEVLSRMEELAEWQRSRVVSLKTKEQESLLPQISAKMAPQEYRHILTQTNAVFNDYRDTLVTLQDIRFKLGLDEFKGPIAGVRGAAVTTTFPDGMSVQKQVFEAITTVEKIFDARRIPPASER